jgi:uncharacterized hydrophobic protein (TIGR00271 family)
MSALLFIDESARELGLGWALSLGAARGESVTVLLAEDAPEPGFPPWAEARCPEHDQARLPQGGVIDGLLAATRERDAKVLVFVQARAAGQAGDERRRRVLRDAPCEVIVVYPADEEREGPALVACAPGPHARAALLVGRDLATGERATGEQAVEALYIEPPVGFEAERVGRRILDRIVRHALGDDAQELGRGVVVNGRREQGIAVRVEETEAALVLLGTAKSSALGRVLRGTVGQRVLRAVEPATVVLVRAALPLTGRFKRRFEAFLQRTVPQLEREERLSLMERVQSSSHWDFDFVTLMSLATLIAALGLIQNSSAVIIGAMLVAPLMVPVLGLGLALVQGNEVLARNALRSVSLGFVTAFLLSWFTGWVHLGFEVPTAEMTARDWPDLTDLVIAFVAGLAAAYASSRPGLLAALPGVAIAAALVPPIATAGLALAVGDTRLAVGASLLFLVNAVAIVLASAVSLWAVGLRYVQGGSKVTRWIGWGALVMLVALGVWLART